MALYTLSTLPIYNRLVGTQGCGKGSSIALLVQLVELVAAVEVHRSAGGEPATSSGLLSNEGMAASLLAPQQLMDAACELGPRFWCDTMQLFPRDMAALMDEYRCACTAVNLSVPTIARACLHSCVCVLCMCACTCVCVYVCVCVCGCVSVCGSARFCL